MRAAVLIAAAVVFVAVIGLRAVSNTGSSGPAATAEVAQHSAESQPSRPSDTDPGTERAPDPETRERRRQEMYQRAAEARFSDAVALDGLRPEQVAPDVRALFRHLRLVPVVAPDDRAPGYVNGLRIQRMPARHPLARKGFREGDRLTRINGVPLQDPAEIAHLMTRLGTKLEVCAARDGDSGASAREAAEARAWCRSIHL